MQDGWSRSINYLRVSVTDRCNLRCFYCMPPEGVPFRDHSQILAYEEITRVARVCVARGVRRIRLTGGEPLLRRQLEVLVGNLAELPGLEEVTLTTNGVLLPDQVRALRSAGLRRVNISLDTLVPERFSRISGGGDWESAWAGVEAALEWHLDPVKLNVVVMKGLNEDEVPAFARLTQSLPLHVRFIELMPLGDRSCCSRDYQLPLDSVPEELRQLGAAAEAGLDGGGPALTFRLPGALGTVGLIRPLSQHFCQSCNRLRLTADGRLKPCLASPLEVNLQPILRSPGGQSQLEQALERALSLKPREHSLGREGRGGNQRFMSEIGG